MSLYFLACVFSESVNDTDYEVEEEEDESEDDGGEELEDDGGGLAEYEGEIFPEICICIPVFVFRFHS